MPPSRLALALVAIASVGCSTSFPRLSFAVEQRILRETTLDDLPEGHARAGDGVVRVVRMGGGARGQCSGALIGPKHVLTAQHCIVRLDARMESTRATIVPGELHVELGGGYLPWGRVGVREIHACDDFADDAEHDVAVLVLSRPVPSDVPTFELGWDLPEEAGVFDLSGFGTPAKPKTMPDTTWLVIESDRHIHRGPVVAVSDRLLAVRVRGVPGDSGGPIVDVATGRVVSVVSRGRAPDEVELDANGKPKPVEPLVFGPRLATCKGAIAAATDGR